MIFLYHSVVPDDSPKERLCAGQALYDLDTLDLVKNAGYEAAFAVLPKNLGVNNHRFQIGRLGIYSASLLKLQLKSLGVADLARSFGLRVG